MIITDSHLHLWNPSRFSYPWLQEFPSLNHERGLPEYQAAINTTGVTKAVYVDTDVSEEDLIAETRWILELADAERLVAGVVAHALPERKNFLAGLSEIGDHPKLKGIRRVLHTQPDDLSESALFRENVRAAGERALSFDLCVQARQLPLAAKLARACPDVSFVLDHCGNPDVKNGILDPWRTQLGELAVLPNVCCKISGIVVNADHATWTVAELRPFVEIVIETFGWERVLWGGDWPVCTLAATLKQWLGAVSEITAQCTESERAKLFHLNAERIYRL